MFTSCVTVILTCTHLSVIVCVLLLSLVSVYFLVNSHIYMYIYMCVCEYVHVYVYIYIYIYIHIYIKRHPPLLAILTDMRSLPYMAVIQVIHSLALWEFKNVIFTIIQNSSLCSRCEIALGWLPVSVQIMDAVRQQTSTCANVHKGHCLYDVNKSQWVNVP